MILALEGLPERLADGRKNAFGFRKIQIYIV